MGGSPFNAAHSWKKNVLFFKCIYFISVFLQGCVGGLQAVYSSFTQLLNPPTVQDLLDIIYIYIYIIYVGKLGHLMFKFNVSIQV